MPETKIRGVSRGFQKPDEHRPFKSHGHLDLLNFSNGGAIGRGVFEPGWRWSNDVQPLVGTRSCEAPHLGYCVSGSMMVRMDDGREFRVNAGEAFEIPPGHDAWVDGSEPCVLLDFTGFKAYAKPERKAA